MLAGWLEQNTNLDTRRVERVNACNIHIKQESKKEFLVAHAHAVIYPRTVVIHFDYAPPTNTAVMGSYGLESFAPLAKFAVLFHRNRNMRP